MMTMDELFTPPEKPLFVDLKLILCTLASGGLIRSARRMPRPHEHTLYSQRDEESGEVAQVTLQWLVDRKIIVGRPIDELWDNITYTGEWAQFHKAASEYFAFAFGTCPDCARFPLGAPSNKLGTPRHLVDEAPCSGHGKPLVDVVVKGVGL